MVRNNWVLYQVQTIIYDNNKIEFLYLLLQNSVINKKTLGDHEGVPAIIPAACTLSHTIVRKIGMTAEPINTPVNRYTQLRFNLAACSTITIGIVNNVTHVIHQFLW